MMSVVEFDTQEELDEEFERIEQINFEHAELIDAVKERQGELDDAESELEVFRENYREELGL